ncbi:MAG: thioredoxin family protein [Gammaproteobacteria bacterium]|nr:thioredoxin family protein [Gammaproteobacteria bacterium]
MSAFYKYRAGLTFVGGTVAGMVMTWAMVQLSGYALISQQNLDGQLQLIAKLQQENYELTDDLFVYKGPNIVFDTSDLPYKNDADAPGTVASARQQALNDEKFLMVTFGANWCLDCRTLYHHLRSPEVRTFTTDTFDFVNVDIGKFNTNVDLATDLGVDLQRGIPVAIVFGPDGDVIGTTNAGQLEPARFYTSKQILKFVRDIVEKSVIAAPDSVR